MESQHTTSTDGVATAEDELHAHWRRVIGRRSFLKSVGVAGAAALPSGAL